MKISSIAIMLLAAVSYTEAIKLHKLDISKLKDYRKVQSLTQTKSKGNNDDLIEKIRADGVVVIGDGE